MKRRKLLKGLAALGAIATTGYWWASKHWDGYIQNPCLEPLPDSIKKTQLWKQIWQGVDPKQVWDCHVHTVGLGDSGSGIWVNPDMQTWQHPLQHIQYQFYMNAACIANPNALDESYYKRILLLLDDLPKGVKLMLLAFDYHHNGKGESVPDLSTFYVPNEFPSSLAQKYPEKFEWVASIHPYRVDAIDQLEQAKATGAVAVKWLPPAQNMDPLSIKCDAFYKKMEQLKLPLITHAGEEKAVQGSDTQELGNPLRLRRALDNGVSVVVAHCASLGENLDMDGQIESKVSSFELFGRLMDEYPQNAYGELSAILQVNRKAEVLKTLLTRTDWHSRLVNGSDYPLPAVMPLISLKKLTNSGLLDEQWHEPLNQIRKHNGLLFDFAVKRLLSHDGQKFPVNAFESSRLFAQSK